MSVEKQIASQPESIKEFLEENKFLNNNPDSAKQTTESISSNPEDISIISNLLYKNILPVIESWTDLDINNPNDIKKAKIIITHDQLSSYETMEWYLPKKPDELINKASRILKEKRNELNFDKKQWATITLTNCDDINQKNQILSYKWEFKSWNAKFDKLLSGQPTIKKYLDLQIMNNNLQRLDSMLWSEREEKEQLRDELFAKRVSIWKEQWRLSSEMFDNKDKLNGFINILTQLEPNEINWEWFYQIKELITDLLYMNNDKTFSYWDLDYDDGIDMDDETWKTTINTPHIETDNMEIISTWSGIIKIKNTVTWQETTLSKNTGKEIKEKREQRDNDWKYIEEKRLSIIKNLNIDIEKNTHDWDISREDNMKIHSMMLKDAFLNDNVLFDAMRRRLDWFEGWEGIDENTWLTLNKILQKKWINNVDCTRLKTTIETKTINNKKVFLLDQWETKVTIPFDGLAKVEYHKMSNKEMNTPIEDTNKSFSYIRAENQIENIKWNRLDLDWLWLNSQEVTSLLSNENLSNKSGLKINLQNNKITKFPTALISMNNVEEIDLWDNFINTLPDENVDKNKCKNLKHIHLDGNNISEISDEFFKINSIEELSLNNNQLSKISESIDKLDNLKILNVSNNSIWELPKNITNIKWLESVSAYDCWLTELPEDINKLENINSLWLASNKLATIWDISNLKNLTHLDVSNNNLNALPPLWELRNLNYLYIDNNNLKIIPNDIKTLPNLKSRIYLSNNISSGDEIQDRFIDGYMSQIWYDFPDWANKFFVDDEQYKFTFSQWLSKSESLENAQNELNINETNNMFVMTKELANGNYSSIVFSSVNSDEYYDPKQ